MPSNNSETIQHLREAGTLHVGAVVCYALLIAFIKPWALDPTTQGELLLVCLGAMTFGSQLTVLAERGLR